MELNQQVVFTFPSQKYTEKIKSWVPEIIPLGEFSSETFTVKRNFQFEKKLVDPKSDKEINRHMYYGPSIEISKSASVNNHNSTFQFPRARIYAK